MSYANDMPTATQTALASTLRLSVMRLARRMRAQRADTMLTLSQLAAHEKISPPSMTRLLGVLEADGLVERTAHPTDRRQVLLAVSPAGQELLKEDRRRRDVWLAQRLRDLDAEELAVLERAAGILDRLAGS